MLDVPGGEAEEQRAVLSASDSASFNLELVEDSTAPAITPGDWFVHFNLIIPSTADVIQSLKDSGHGQLIENEMEAVIPIRSLSPRGGQSTQDIVALVKDLDNYTWQIMEAKRSGLVQEPLCSVTLRTTNLEKTIASCNRLLGLHVTQQYEASHGPPEYKTALLGFGPELETVQLEFRQTDTPPLVQRGDGIVRFVVGCSDLEAKELALKQAKGAMEKVDIGSVEGPGAKETALCTVLEPDGLWQANGYMDKDIFRMWMINVFLKETEHLRSKEKPVMLVLDGHGSHTNDPALLEMCKENHVELILLIPHATHLLQPLDVSVMKPLKAALNQSRNHFIQKYPRRLITPKTLVEMLVNPNSIYGGPGSLPPIEVGIKVQNIVSGFRATGLYPFDASKVYPKLASEEPAAEEVEVPEVVVEEEEEEEEVDNFYQRTAKSLFKWHRKNPAASARGSKLLNADGTLPHTLDELLSIAVAREEKEQENDKKKQENDKNRESTAAGKENKRRGRPLGSKNKKKKGDDVERQQAGRPRSTVGK